MRKVNLVLISLLAVLLSTLTSCKEPPQLPAEVRLITANAQAEAATMSVIDMVESFEYEAGLRVRRDPHFVRFSESFKKQINFMAENQAVYYKTAYYEKVLTDLRILRDVARDFGEEKLEDPIETAMDAWEKAQDLEEDSGFLYN